MDKEKVLFVCVHNSARSQIAEAYLNALGGDRFEAYSAGLEPTTINPLAVAVMKEEGIDIARNQTKGVFDLYKKNMLFRYVISVCDEASQRCPIFPGAFETIKWSFPDPAGLTGTHEVKLRETRKIRDMIKTKVTEFVKRGENVSR